MTHRATARAERRHVQGGSRSSPLFKPTLIATSVALAFSGIPHALAQWKPNVEVLLMPGDKRSYMGVDGVLPFWQNSYSLAFADLKARLAEHDANEFNLGLGYRRLTESQHWAFGAYAALDRRRTPVGSDFTQITLGAEALSDSWDFRLNYYHPTRNKQLVGLGATQFQGFGVFRNGVYEEAMRGGDFEVGKLLPFSEKVETRVFLAGYTFDAKDLGANADGARVRVEVRPRQDVILGLSVQHDNLFKTAWFAEVRYAFGKAPKQGVRKLTDRMTDPWTRDIDVQVTPMTESTSIAFAQQQPGMAVHVDSSKPAGGDGSYEQPYNLVATCEAAKCADPNFGTIRLWKGSSAATPYTPVTLISGKTLWGEGVDIFTGAVATGMHPVVVNPAGGAITLTAGGSNFTVAGVDARSIGGAGILGNNVTGNVTIRDSLIRGNSGIQLIDTTFTGNRTSNIAITNNQITALNGMGVNIVNTAAGGAASRQQTVTISGNAISAAEGAAIQVQNAAKYGGTATQNVTVTGNMLSAVDRGGVTLANLAIEGGSATQKATVANNTIAASGNDVKYAAGVINYGIEGGRATQTVSLTGNTITAAGAEVKYGVNAFNVAAEAGRGTQNVTLSGNTITASSSDTGKYRSGFGALNLAAEAGIARQDVMLTNNTINASGTMGGIALIGIGGKYSNSGTSIQNATISGNTVKTTGAPSGGLRALVIATDADSTARQNLTLTDNSIRANGAGSLGLALVSRADGGNTMQTTTITNNTIRANGVAAEFASDAEDGGTVAQSVTLTGSTLTATGAPNVGIRMGTFNNGGTNTQGVLLQNTTLDANTPVQNTGTGTCTGGGVPDCP